MEVSYVLCRCNADAGTEKGRLLSTIQSIMTAIIFGLLLICYGSIAVKVIITNRRSQRTHARHIRPIKVMAVFLVAYLIQWWPTVTLAFVLGHQTSLATIITIVIFCNLGGAFNALAYTVIRKHI